MKALHDSVVAIVGMGLMGGSLALALRAQNGCRKIIGVTRNPRTRADALARGAVDAVGADLGLVAEADVVVLTTPVRTILRQLPQVGAVVHAGTVVMDFGSTKRDVVAGMQSLPPHIEPIGAHPMCGKETSGFESSEVSLYRNAVFVLTPLDRTSPQTLALAESLVTTLEARPIVLDATRHDQIAAAVSHLPFALAVALMATADELADADDQLYALAASGFRDTSRLAASDVTMMLDILLTNRDNITDLLRACARHLGDLADLIAVGNEPALRVRLERAAIRRRELFK
jgi:prephenate dehydrogenase